MRNKAKTTFLKRALLTLLTTLAFDAKADSSRSEASMQRLMQRPLIVGASVSADWASKSPGKLLALRYTDESQIKTIAFAGKSGREVLKKVSADSFADRSVVIGLDLFFWDATLKAPEESLRALESLMATVKAKDIPIILGEVPRLMPNMQPQAQLLNAAMSKACASYEKCALVPFTAMLFQVLRDGALHYKGARYGLRELIPDGLHIGPIASQYIADSIYDKLVGSAW